MLICNYRGVSELAGPSDVAPGLNLFLTSRGFGNSVKARSRVNRLSGLLGLLVGGFMLVTAIYVGAR